MRTFFRALLAATLVGVAGCDKATEPTPVITGTWSGSGGGISAMMTLTQSGSAVTGNGSMSGSGGAAALTISGSFTNPNFSLTVSSPGFENFNFSGTLSGNSMTGVLNGSGFNQAGMTMTRQ
jgi:hypothetical protein